MIRYGWATVCGLGLWLAATAVASAQAEGGFVDEALDVGEPERAAQIRVRNLIFGREDAPNLNSPEARRSIKAMVQWYLYRLTWDRVQAARESSVSEIMEEVLGDGNPNSATRLFPGLVARRPGADQDQNATRARQRAYVAALTSEALPEIQKLLQQRKPIVRVNAARVLERFAEWGQTDIVDTLLGIMANPNEHDAVRVWAIKALGILLGEYAENGNFGERDPGGRKYKDAALAVYDWLAKNAAMPPEEVSRRSTEEQDAVSYMRRQAIVALGNTLRPRLSEGAPNIPPEGPIAELFVKIMDGKEVTPPARWQERAVAAEQLCRLRPRLSAAYQPDFVVERLAQFISALGSEAAADSARTKQRWRHIAISLKLALDELDNQLLPNTPGKTYLAKLQPRLIAVLEYIDDSARNPQAPRDLYLWLEENSAATKSVFRP